MPTWSSPFPRIAAAVLAAIAAAGCASGGTTQEDSGFAKSLREADPTKKGEAARKPEAAPAEPKNATSGGSEFKLPGRRVYLEYDDVGAGRKLGIVNRSAADPSEVYNQSQPGAAFVKVATDDLMADLCEGLRRLEFSKLSEPAAPKGAAPQWTLTMDVDGERKSVYYVRGREPERQRKLTNIQAAFLWGFNRVYGLKSVGAEEGGKGLFQDEKSKLDAQKQETLKKTNEKP